MAKFKNQIVATGFFVLSFLFPLKTWAATFSGIYAFGDSLSDTGNTLNTTKLLNFINPEIPIIPPDPPYFKGRFSNGPIWLDYLSQKLGLTPSLFTDVLGGAIATDGINFAYGGATTGVPNTLGLLGLQQQVGFYTSTVTQADETALYVVFAGGNDYLPTISDFKPFQQPDVPLGNLSAAVKSLAGVGAKNIMVVNLPDLDKIPRTRGTALAEQLKTLTEDHNRGLTQKLDALSGELGSGVNLIRADINSLFDPVVANPSAFGFANATDACLTFTSIVNICSNPDEFLFWDQLHLTSAGHRLLGEYAFSLVNSAQPNTSVPEPGSTAGILAFGLLGTAAALKRKSQKFSQKPAIAPVAATLET